jgi:hypothetical protein
LHGTYRDDVAQGDIVIGVDDPQAERDVAILPALFAPAHEDGGREEG